MRFPITDLLSEQNCHDFLLGLLHPDGLGCPSGHPLPDGQHPHRRVRATVADYRCRTCGKVFNLFTGTVWARTHYSCAKIVLILRGFAQGTPTLQLADELGCDYGTLLGYRHEMQAAALLLQDTSPLPGAVTEADEAFQNAGEKGDRHRPPSATLTIGRPTPRSSRKTAMSRLARTVASPTISDVSTTPFAIGFRVWPGNPWPFPKSWKTISASSGFLSITIIFQRLTFHKSWQLQDYPSDYSGWL